MNIDEYRAMVEAEKNAPPQEPVTEPEVEQESVPTDEPKSTEPESNVPQTFDVNGQQVTLEELQRGYLRQSDYTKKTQEISRQQRELERLQQLKEQVEAHPELAQQVGYDPQATYQQELEASYYDLLVQQEVNELSTRYADFDAQSVLEFASENEMDNLEHAYLLHKQLVPSQPKIDAYTKPADPVVDVEALKAQLRAELQAEMNTSTIISGGGTPPTPPKEIQLSAHEQKIARAFKLTPEQYKRWS
jgi:hypothetical protein